MHISCTLRLTNNSTWRSAPTYRNVTKTSCRVQPIVLSVLPIQIPYCVSCPNSLKSWNTHLHIQRSSIGYRSLHAGSNISSSQYRTIKSCSVTPSGSFSAFGDIHGCFYWKNYIYQRRYQVVERRSWELLKQDMIYYPESKYNSNLETTRSLRRSLVQAILRSFEANQLHQLVTDLDQSKVVSHKRPLVKHPQIDSAYTNMWKRHLGQAAKCRHQLTPWNFPDRSYYRRPIDLR